ncbi:HAD family hydrolase [Phormidium sp. FACHB-1136]|uniref:HAD family hydrolase n=1 Tax=Phormidium sp. FACHB-1136 TaxID=2692848 RepID=UPI001681C5DA|nr:HAD family hydrolase [Phormidium sp. FACHB-1136]MBD2427593.1 HAD hydrolase-like protein [Phormidium sp. FACHB-1136]
MANIKLIAFDMAGTTVKDDNEVLHCFFEAAKQTGLMAYADRVNAMMGLPKKVVFQTLWADQIGAASEDYFAKVEASYDCFRTVLEHHYRTQTVAPTEGCLALFDWLRSRSIAIALTTGFYREVTQIILHRLGWDVGLDPTSYVGSAQSTIQMSVTPSEIYGNEGRPAPFMIQKAMYRLGIDDPKTVIAIGDTPSDLASARHAGCLYACGVTNGTHTQAQLANHANDGLFHSLAHFQQQLEQWID